MKSLDYSSQQIRLSVLELRKEMENLKAGSRLRDIVQDIHSEMTRLERLIIGAKPTVIMKPPLWRLPTMRIKGPPPPLPKERTKRS